MSLGRENIIMSQVKIQDYASSQYLVFNKDEKLEKIIDHFKKNEVTEGYFVDNKNQFLGKIRLIDVIGKKGEIGFLYKQN